MWLATKTPPLCRMWLRTWWPLPELTGSSVTHSFTHWHTLIWVFGDFKGTCDPSMSVFTALSQTHTKFHSPAVPPTAMAALIWPRSSGEGFRTPRVAAMPPATPIIPRALPRRAEDWVDRPPRAPTQHRPEPRYIIWAKWKKRKYRKWSLAVTSSWMDVSMRFCDLLNSKLIRNKNALSQVYFQLKYHEAIKTWFYIISSDIAVQDSF